MANKLITPQELVREISDTAERIGAAHGLTEDQIAELKLRTCSWIGGQPMEMGDVQSASGSE